MANCTTDPAASPPTQQATETHLREQQLRIYHAAHSVEIAMKAGHRSRGVSIGAAGRRILYVEGAAGRVQPVG
jgi:hypothetical protein